MSLLRHVDGNSILAHLESVTLGIVTELRLTGKSADGAYLSLSDGQTGEYTLRISDTLRATINQPRLAAVRTNEGETISVREIQARLRSGESMETLAREADCSIDKIERFAGPIVQERAYIIELAQDVVMRKESGREPVTFAELVTIHLAPRQVDMSAVEWNTWRIENGSWIVQVHYPNRDGIGVADWSFDLTRRALAALNDDARWIVGDENSTERAPIDHGLVYGNHPSARHTPEPRPLEGRGGPHLVAIRDTSSANRADTANTTRSAVTGRAKVPSWDEIMFGTSKKNENENKEEPDF